MSKLKSLVLIVLSFGLFLSLASNANTTPIASEPTLGNFVSVGRSLAYESVAGMEADINAELVQHDIGDLLTAAAGDLTEADIARHLTDLEWDVSSMSVEDVEYIFVIDPDGKVRKICIIDSEIQIDDGGASPIFVSIHSRLEV